MPRYSIYAEKENKMDRTPMKLYDKGKLETKFDLERIDRYVAQFQNQDDFITHMVKYNSIQFIPKRCFIGYTMNGEILEKKMLYNNKLIYNAAKDIIQKKKNKLDKSKIILTPNSDINTFINDITNLGINDNKAFNYMLSSPLFPKYIYELFQQYRQIKSQNEYISSELQSDLNEIKGQISYNLRKYNYFRTVYIWKNNYEKLQKRNQPDDKKNDYNQLELSSFMDMNPSKINHNKEYTQGDYEVNNDEMEDNINKNDDKKEYIKYIYSCYGIEGVMNFFDRDELEDYLSDEEIHEMKLK